MPPPKPLNVLLIGAGAREHALAAAIARSPRLNTLFATGTTNPGIAALASPVPVPIDIKQIYRLQQFCDANTIDLIVIGPEDPLAQGYADALAAPNRLIFGPSASAARLEADKAWSKKLMRAAAIPTAEGRAFTDPDAADEYFTSRTEAQVIKAAGLAKGKGVILPDTLEQGLDAIDRIMRRREFADAGKTLIIEERINGREVSVLAITDGASILVLPPCQDHKRLRDNDEGPNTGGMGAFCPADTLDDDTMSRVETDVLIPTLDALRREEIIYKGVIYAGLILTPAGPKVLEFNCRFGDPECQPLMARLESDVIDLLCAPAQGTLDEIDVRWSDKHAVCVVLASEGYPAKPTTGIPIDGVEDADAMDGVTVLHGATKMVGGQLVTDGGRVLSVTALGGTLADARERAYTAADKIKFQGKIYRTDIASHTAAPTT